MNKSTKIIRRTALVLAGSEAGLAMATALVACRGSDRRPLIAMPPTVVAGLRLCLDRSGSISLGARLGCRGIRNFRGSRHRAPNR